MNAKSTKKYLLAKPGAVEDYPFGEEVAVFKVKDKMFATLVSHRPNEPNPKFRDCAQINLKCDPDEALALRDIFDAVVPGYHMNKNHWNTVVLYKSIPKGEIQRMIDCYYGLVVKSLKKADRLALELKYGEDKLFS
jgi:predicted DNA-binding protein (MmcQ/YjbR family)